MGKGVGVGVGVTVQANRILYVALLGNLIHYVCLNDCLMVA